MMWVRWNIPQWGGWGGDIMLNVAVAVSTTAEIHPYVVLIVYGLLFSHQAEVSFGVNPRGAAHLLREAWLVRYNALPSTGSPTSPSPEGPEVILLTQYAFFLVWVLYTRITLGGGEGGDRLSTSSDNHFCCTSLALKNST